jgi:hypothetical protein
MAAEAFKPVTTIQEPGIQGMPRTYTSTREVSAEWEPPIRGSVLGGILSQRFRTHIVLDAVVQPSGGKLVATISHCAPSAWTVLLGSSDRQDGSGEHLYERQVVPTPTQSQIEEDALSSYEPIDEAKSLRITKKPRRKTASGTYEDGYPQKQVKSKGVDNLTPQKYKGQTTTIETITTEALDPAQVDNIPDPENPAGNVTKVTHQKLNDEQYSRAITEEVIAENQIPLTGEEYGDIVTKAVEEKLVPDGTPAATGIDVISSVVSPLGNGKSVEETKRVKGGWPDPLERELSLDPPNIPSKLRRFIQRLTSKKKIGSIPANPTLGAGEVGLGFKQETPDRVEQTTVTEQVGLGSVSDEIVIEQKPFVRITATTKTQTFSNPPVSGNGGSRIIYDNGAGTVVWDNTAEVATPRPGLKGIETNGQAWGRIVQTINYSTSSTPPAGGSSSVVYSDGSVQVYEVSAPSINVSGGTSDFDNTQWGGITWTGTYGTSPVAGLGRRSRQVYSNGATSVYLNETSSALVSGSKRDIDAQSWGKLIWNGSYSTSASGDKSNQVWSNGTTSVYLNETASLQVSGSTKDIDAHSWGSITWNGSYSGASGGDKSRQVYSGPGGSVYLNETATLNLTDGSFVSAKETNVLLTETQTTTYGTSPVANDKNTRSRLVYSLKQHKVYENIKITRVAAPTRKYMSVIDVNIPPEILKFTKHTYSKKDGTETYRWEPDIREGYRGPYLAEVTEYWQETPNLAREPEKISPAPISFQTPLGGVSVGATLHPAYRFFIQIGTNHPEYDYQLWEQDIPATTPQTLRGRKILYHIETQAYRDGFIIREYRITIPS